MVNVKMGKKGIRKRVSVCMCVHVCIEREGERERERERERESKTDHECMSNCMLAVQCQACTLFLSMHVILQ